MVCVCVRAREKDRYCSMRAEVQQLLEMLLFENVTPRVCVAHKCVCLREKERESVRARARERKSERESERKREPVVCVHKRSCCMRCCFLRLLSRVCVLRIGVCI